MMPTKQRDIFMKNNFWDNPPYWFGFNSELDYYCWEQQMIEDYLKEIGYKYEWEDDEFYN